jgi:hypothetical protein
MCEWIAAQVKYGALKSESLGAVECRCVRCSKGKLSTIYCPVGASRIEGERDTREAMNLCGVRNLYFDETAMQGGNAYTAISHQSFFNR